MIVVVMRYVVKIINLILADICTATKLNSFHPGFFPIYVSYNTCKFVFFFLYFLLSIIKTTTLVCTGNRCG